MNISIKTHIFIILGCFTVIFSGFLMYQQTKEYRTLKAYPVVLMEAYSSTVKTGMYTSKEVFRGLFFHEKSNIVFNRQLDGFLYSRFSENDKKPLTTTLELSRIDLGEKEPAYAQIALLTACSTTAVFCVYFLTFLFCGFNNKREEMY